MKQRFKSADSSAEEPTFPGTKAVVRAMAVLKAFRWDRSAWGLTELAEELSLSKATVFRLVGALEREGMLTRDPEREVYRLGPELIVLGTLALRSADLREVARPQLQALANRTGESATLEVLVGEDTLILDEVLGRFRLSGSAEVGTRWPAHTTSTGKVLLAAARKQGRALPHRLEALTPNSITSAARFEHELERVIEQGYAVAMEELERGFMAIGAPVRDREGKVVAALSIGGPTGRMTADRIPHLGALVQSAADEVSRRLGATPSMLLDSSCEGPTRQSSSAGESLRQDQVVIPHLEDGP